MTFPVLGGNGAVAGAFSIDNSLIFNDDDSAYLYKDFGSASNRKTWTWSGWIKRGNLGTTTGDQSIFDARESGNGNPSFEMSFDGNAGGGASNDAIDIVMFTSSIDYRLITTQVFRDVSAWYHIVFAVDTTQATASDRLKLYVNGSQITAFDTETYPSLNFEGAVNNNKRHAIGSLAYGGNYFDGYATEINFIDGQALTPSDFGEFDEDSGIWKPKRYSGSYGTNGFYLPFNNIGQIHNITAYGDVHHETDEQKIGATSIEFDGTGDYLSLDDKSQFKFGTGDFTIEFFAKMGDQANTFTTLFNDPSGGNKLRVDTGDSTTAPKLSFYSSAWDERTSGTTDLSDNAWHHCAIVRDNGTLRIFVDGTQEATRASSTQDVDSSGVFEIGRYNGGTRYFDGYLDEIRISNVARYTGSFTPTTSAFTKDDNTRLLIHSNSSDGNTTFTDDSGSDGGIGDDASGNNNDFTTTNISDYTDQTTDTPTNNFATLNSLDNYWANSTFSEGNCKMVTAGSGYGYPRSTIGVSSGKWYFEAKASNLSGNLFVGIVSTTGTGTEQEVGNKSNDYGYKFTSGAIRENTVETSYGDSLGTSDILGVGIDLDNNKLYFSKNGTWQNSANPETNTGGFSITAPSSTLLGEYFASASDINSVNSSTVAFNFGNPAFSVSSGNADGNGYGNFEYAPPSGYLALCTQNLATELSPTISDGSQYFNTILYTGDGTSNRSITGAGFQPDWGWLKQRNGTGFHELYDSTRGVTKALHSNTSDAEVTTSALDSFDSDGITVSFDSNNSGSNGSGKSVVWWLWRGSDSNAVSNTDGSITSTVSANQTSGFSVVTYTGNGTDNSTIGHGLGKAPAMIILKARSSIEDWMVYHKNLTAGSEIRLNSSSGQSDDTNNATWGDNHPSSVGSSTFAVGYAGDSNSNGNTYVAYCFAEIEGYSKFGKWTGTGSQPSPFVYTGFKPSWIMYKRLDTSSIWVMIDAKRSPINSTDKYLRADTSASESTYDILNFMSNGFEIDIISPDASTNTSGADVIYMAFAENPFVTSSGVPNTAK